VADFANEDTRNLMNDELVNVSHQLYNNHYAISKNYILVVS